MGAGHCGLHARPSSYAGIIRVRFQGRGPAASSQRLLPWVVLHNSTSTGGFVKEPRPSSWHNALSFVI